MKNDEVIVDKENKEADEIKSARTSNKKFKVKNQYYECENEDLFSSTYEEEESDEYDPFKDEEFLSVR